MQASPEIASPTPIMPKVERCELRDSSIASKEGLFRSGKSEMQFGGTAEVSLVDFHPQQLNCD